MMSRKTTTRGKRVFSTWTARKRHNTPSWLSFLPRLCEMLVQGPGKSGPALAAWLLAREAAAFQQAYLSLLRLSACRFKDETLRTWHGDVLALLEGAAVIQATSVRDEIVTFLTAPATALPLMDAGDLLKQAREQRHPAAVRALGMYPLYRHVADGLEALLAAPARAADDWSIEPPMQCKCTLCQELSIFLRARSRIEYAWPLAEQRRRHIHNVIDRHRLPVTHTTVRHGSPFSLVLKKQPALFSQDAALRKRQQALLTWLNKERSAFAD